MRPTNERNLAQDVRQWPRPVRIFTNCNNAFKVGGGRSSGKLTQHLCDMHATLPQIPPPTLRLALALTVAVERRSRPAALQALRLIWEQSETDDAAFRAARQVNLCLEPEQRHWLECLRLAP